MIRRRVVPLGLGVALSFAAPGCSLSKEEELSFGRELSFAAGRATRTFVIQAPDPRTHTFDVRVSARANTDVGVRIRTFYGTELDVLASTQRSDCNRNGARATWMIPLPALEAQRAGRWTVVVTKKSQGPAKVEVQVTFEPLPDQP